MATESLGASFSIDVTDLKAGLAQANRLIRESESEFKAAAAGMDDWSSSADGLGAQQKNLNNITDIQRKKVDALQDQYNTLIKNGLDPASKEAIELRTKINQETASLNKNEKALNEVTAKLKELEENADEAGDAADDLGGSFDGLKSIGAGVAGVIAGVAAACAAAVGAFFGLAESTRESRDNMARLETAFDSAGMSAATAEGAFTDLYGILGDEGQATEAAQQLAKISKDEDDLAANTRILTGVMAEYGDSIPTEGLAEGMAATAAMGEVQGVLADALEWQGVNLEDYNAKLATLSTEEERAAYIQETLSGLYGDSADAYREANAEVIAAQEAQAGLNLALNELGAIAEPIMTTLKTLATELLQDIMPFVKLMGEGLRGALEGDALAADSLAEGLTGIVDKLVDVVTDMLPAVVDVVIALVPKIINALLGQLPTLIDTAMNIVLRLLDALTTMLPQIITAVIALVPQIINKLIAYIPQLLKAAVTLLMAIVNALPTIIANLITALPSVIQTIVTALVESIPILIQAAIQLFLAIVKAIPVIIDALIVALPQIITCIINGLIEAIPQLLDGAIQMFMAIIEAIPTIVEALYGKMPVIIAAILSALVEAIPTLLKTSVSMFGKILEAAGNLAKELPSKMGDIIKAIVKGLSDGIGDVFDIGQDLIEGLWDGIADMTDWITDKLEGFGDTVLEGIKDFFGIASPSKVMADVVGKNLALGMGEGFEDEIDDVNKKITGSFDAIVGGGVSPNINTSNPAGGGSVVINQNNHYSQAHSRYELWNSRKQIAAAVRLATS